ncbi:MAG: hypothetical protein KAH68_03370 [Draconibacterium sp.]|nr:hypothetical protein [Draconibacterium sp.]
MKTKITLVFLFICIALISKAQPQKGTWEVGGSGYFNKSYTKNKEAKFKIPKINAEVNCFIFKHLSIGTIVTFQSDKNYDRESEPTIRELFIAPTIDAYLLNRDKFAISMKGALNFIVASNLTIETRIPSYMIGPKFSWNISPNLSTFIWPAYRRLEEFDNTIGFLSTVPSDNFDIRWGFSYFFHRKIKE